MLQKKVDESRKKKRLKYLDLWIRATSDVFLVKK